MVLDELAYLRHEFDAEKAVTQGLRKELDLETSNVMLLKQQLENNENADQLLKQRQEKTEEILATVELRHDEEGEQIAFSVATYSSFGPVSLDSNIPMEITYTNIGGGWNSVANVFQAPVAGTYHFTASMHVTGSQLALCYIVHSTTVDQTKVAALYDGYDDGQSDANAVILELEAGDYVHFQLAAYADSQIYNTVENVYTTFSGFLLFT